LEQALRHHSDDAEHHGHSDQQEKALRVTSRWEKLVGHVRSRRFPQHPPVRPRYRGRIPWPHELRLDVAHAERYSPSSEAR
jgi:hypothetical protein